MKRVCPGAAAALVLWSSAAWAGEGPCGIELGVWASSKAACQYADKPDEARKRFGSAVLLVIDKKGYRAESYCRVRSSSAKGKSCKLQVSCDGEPKYTGDAEFYMRAPDQIGSGGSGVASLYHHCGTASAGR